MCLLVFSIHCSVISLSIIKVSVLVSAIQLSGSIGIADTFLNEYQYCYQRYFHWNEKWIFTSAKGLWSKICAKWFFPKSGTVFLVNIKLNECYHFFTSVLIAAHLPDCISCCCSVLASWIFFNNIHSYSCFMNQLLLYALLLSNPYLYSVYSICLHCSGDQEENHVLNWMPMAVHWLNQTESLVTS
jgi:hypothetical protein